MQHKKLLLLDLGSQVTQTNMQRRVFDEDGAILREFTAGDVICCEILSALKRQSKRLKGNILSGRHCILVEQGLNMEKER